MKSLELNVLFLTENHAELEILGINSNINDCVVDKMTFYTIDAISRNTEDIKNDYTDIFACGDTFVCVDSYEVVKEKIKNNL